MNQPHAIMFHHFCDEVHPKGQGAISGQEFNHIINYLRNNFNLIKASEWLDKFQSNSLEKDDVCLTFDDSLKCQFDIARPVLKDRNLDAFWFLCSSFLQGGYERLEIYRYFRTTKFNDIDDYYSEFFKALNESQYNSEVSKALENFQVKEYLKGFAFYSDNDRKFRFVRDKVLGIEKYNSIMDIMVEKSDLDVEELRKSLWMNEDEVKLLRSEGNIIGLHSHSHPTQLATFNHEQQLSEYSRNQKFLEQLLNEKITTMSHPCNSYNSDTLDILKGLGVTLGFRANVSQTEHGPLEFPREDHTNVLKRIQS